jgi:hypothetical protein
MIGMSEFAVIHVRQAFQPDIHRWVSARRSEAPVATWKG